MTGPRSSLIDEIYQCICGYRMIIWRPSGKRRKKEHKKWLYCPLCDKKSDFIKQEE